ncbi:DUF4232 domain-containing protein [Streptomyces sp. NPDC005492]|uniref:DUF4232 domain-containing protein n=1 Tax=Streptomyces sp. NPDC005492 TaxID=3156883 RepID=UPI0033AB07E6
MRVHKLTFAVLAVTAGLSLTACQSGNDDASGVQSDPSSTSTSTVAPGSATSSTTGGSGSGGSTGSGTAGGSGTGTGSNANAKAGKCRTADLKITAQDNTIDGDTDGTVVVTFTNDSGKDCRISGYAGVDLQTNAGTVSAQRTGQAATSAVLKNGKSTYFPISYPVNNTGGSGVRITGLVVTPPDETKSVTLAWPGAASLPVSDSAGTPVKVGPVGSAGQGG